MKLIVVLLCAVTSNLFGLYSAQTDTINPKLLENLREKLDEMYRIQCSCAAFSDWFGDGADILRGMVYIRSPSPAKKSSGTSSAEASAMLSVLVSTVVEKIDEIGAKNMKLAENAYLDYMTKNSNKMACINKELLISKLQHQNSNIVKTVDSIVDRMYKQTNELYKSVRGIEMNYIDALFMDKKMRDKIKAALSDLAKFAMQTSTPKPDAIKKKETEVNTTIIKPLQTVLDGDRKALSKLFKEVGELYDVYNTKQRESRDEIFGLFKAKN
ncbi:uncharacterized protein LOC129565392 [Sitodiplosis mosellana]|uniref:uncharacterized protein LOC129565392 n=1 Tax=Sitodiplosis mosellana TaxID=263140 RepID=UPI0024451D6F|nr:uncharacterized protein LOC129565392 [Sitodiplosis mosellana]